MLHRLTIEVRGAVQGVGFRPFVFRLAEELGLAGWVLNDARGVFVEAEGERAPLERFLERIAAEPPPLAQIHALEHAWAEPAGYRGFAIRHSDDAGARTTLVLPDVATCPDCLAEVLDPSDRRHRYAFTNCTNCGPRLTIVESLPYDRPNTTMRAFALCPACRAEYENPRDRRFHAQPTACPSCGPRLELWLPTTDDQEPMGKHQRAAKGEGSRVDHALVFHPSSSVSGDSALRAAARLLRQGALLAVKGLGGFHLICDARDEAAVARLRERKPRREKPFALMARDLEQIRALCHVSPAEEALLTSPAAPIVLLRRSDQPPTANDQRLSVMPQNISAAESAPSSLDAGPSSTAPGPSSAPPVAKNVAPGNPTLGVMLPATPLHHLLMRELDGPVVATSGNLSDEPICTDEREAVARLGHIADAFLVHDRPIARHVDDSVTMIMDSEPRILRRARGYAPLPVLLRRPAPCVLAVGAHLKNTIALSVGRQAFISQHIGDMETPEARAAFERVVADFLRLYEARPAAVAHDMHPDYATTRFAREILAAQGEREVLGIPVQHHHAHLAACLAEHHCEEQALGVTWDGTGYGLDGTVWGGEFLLGNQAESRRVAHLLPFRLPGGDAVAREPRRAALALLWELLGPAALERADLAPIAALAPAERRVLGQMLARGVGAPVTTSAGRLFDGVAALVGLCQRASFEGQAAMALEWAADPHERGAYPLELLDSHTLSPVAEKGARGEGLLLDWRPTLDALLGDLTCSVGTPVIAARFHNTLVDAIERVALHVGAGRIALTGGCFQNRLLAERAADRLRAAGFDTLLHRQVPPGDGGISLGQVAAAAARMR
ncbi:MAG: carbamoyltransferase HypF [Chloroflexota bacterium]